MFFTAHGGASGEGRVMTNGLTVAAPFGGGGVSDVTYDIANADEMQVLISGGLGEARRRTAGLKPRYAQRRVDHNELPGLAFPLPFLQYEFWR